MEENKKNTNDVQSVQDFGMGSDGPETQSAPEHPTINNYQNAEAPSPAEPAVPAPTDNLNPAGSPPPAAPAATPAPPAPAIQPIPRRPMPTGTGQTASNPAARKKAILGCLGAFGGFLIIFLILSFVFLAQSDSGISPIAKLLGLNQAAFVNGLITFIHLIFILLSLTFFVFTMIGLFRASMAKRDDRETKKQGMKMSLISGLILVFIVIAWGFVYIYLDAKHIVVDPENVAPPIITDPEEPLDLSAPVEVRFDASNIDVDRTKYQIVSHEWDFGDGEKGTSQIVSHRYEEKGTYDVKLVVTVREKETGDVSVGGEFHLTVSVTNQALTASFTADPQTGEAPLSVTFDASDSIDPDGYLETYEWDLDGDGSFDDAEGKTAEYEFDKIGKYTVSLRVTSTTGEFDVSEKEIEVKEQSTPEAVITITDEPTAFTVGTNYIFKSDDASSPNGKIVEYEWDFGDGSRVQTTKTVSHAFNSAGTYDVTLTVTDEEEKEGVMTKTISVGKIQGTPKAVINTTPSLQTGASTLEGAVPFAVVFDAGGSTDSDNNIVNYEWDYDNNGVNDGFGRTVSHTFAKQGSYTVSLTVTDSDGNKGTENLIVNVLSQGLVASLQASQVEGNVPLAVTFDASGSSYQDGSITAYQWDFGDGSAPKLGDSRITHKYTKIGSYTASVKVIGADNSSSTAQITITIREIPLSACFTSVFTSGKAPLETSFDPGCSTGTISSYFWSFGDGGTSTNVKPTHVFEKPGEYTVTLEVSDSQNTVNQFDLNISVKAQ